MIDAENICYKADNQEPNVFLCKFRIVPFLDTKLGSFILNDFFFNLLKTLELYRKPRKTMFFLRLTPELFRFNANNLTTGDRRQGD